MMRTKSINHAVALYGPMARVLGVKELGTRRTIFRREDSNPMLAVFGRFEIDWGGP